MKNNITYEEKFFNFLDQHMQNLIEFEETYDALEKLDRGASKELPPNALLCLARFLEPRSKFIDRKNNNSCLLYCEINGLIRKIQEDSKNV